MWNKTPLSAASVLLFDHAYLVSGLQIESRRPEMTAVLGRFLEGRALTDPALFLLGDIFEVWVGSDSNDTKSCHVTQLLTRLDRSDVQVYLMHGGYDFLGGALFSQRISLQLVPHPTAEHVLDVRALTAPVVASRGGGGVAMSSSSLDRTPAWQKKLIDMPPQFRRSLGRVGRHERLGSSHKRTGLAMGFADINEAACAALVEKLDSMRLVHGHAHRPAAHPLALPDGRILERIILADWHNAAGAALEARPDDLLDLRALS